MKRHLLRNPLLRKELLLLLFILALSPLFFMSAPQSEIHLESVFSPLETFSNDFFQNEQNSITGAVIGTAGDIGIASANSTSCGTVTSNLTLAANLTTTTDCLTVGASAVTIDCAGFTISGDGGDTGIVVDGDDNVTIKNCHISSFQYGINAYSTTLDLEIYNSSFTSNQRGILVNNLVSFNVTNNSFTGNSAYGMEVGATNTQTGTIYGNLFYDTGLDDNEGVTLCNGYGNYYHHNVTYSTNHIDPDDCGPTPNSTVTINQSAGTSFTWGGNATYATWQEGLYNTYSANISIASGSGPYQLSSDQDVAHGDLVIDCNSEQLNSTSAGIYRAIDIENKDNVSIHSCLFTNFDYGVYVTSGSDNASIFNNNFTDNDVGVIFTNGVADFNSTNNTFHSNTNYGVTVAAVGTQTGKIYGNYFYDTGLDDNEGVTLCNNYGNYYDGAIVYSTNHIDPDDCGPTPNSAVTVNQSAVTSFTWGGTATYATWQEGLYNTYGSTLTLASSSGPYQLSSNQDVAHDDFVINCNGEQLNSTSAGSNRAIELENKDNVSIHGCLFTNFDYGVYVTSGSDNITIFNNNFTDNDYGMTFRNTVDDFNVTNNTFHSNTNYGVNIEGVGAQDGWVYGNYFYDTGMNDDDEDMDLCRVGYGNYYGESVTYNTNNIDPDDCGPTPGGTIIINQSAGTSFTWGGNANYATFKEGLYNSKGTITIASGSGPYQLSSDQDVARGDLEINCNGEQLNSTSAGSYRAIDIENKDNVSVHSCLFTNFNYGVYVTSGSDNASIFNNNFTDNDYGIMFTTTVNDFNVTNNTFHSNTNNGVNIAGSGAQDGWVYGNYFYDTGMNDDDEDMDLCRVGYGNYYDATVPYDTNNHIDSGDCGPAPSGTIYVNPSSQPIINWGQNVTVTNLSAGVYNSNGSIEVVNGTGPYPEQLTSIRDDINLNCNGETLQGTGIGTGIYISGENGWTIFNCTFDNFNTGVRLENTQNSLINRSLFINNDDEAIWIDDGADYNVITNTNFSRNDVYGIEFFISATAEYNNITKNTFEHHPNYAIRTDPEARNSSIWGNNFINNSGSNNQSYSDHSSNMFNSTEYGNYWDDYDEVSEGCNDADVNNVCDDPYNISGSALNQDFLPSVQPFDWDANAVPNVTQVLLNATSLSNYTTDNLTCYATVSDTDHPSVSVNYTWYNNSVEVSSLSGQTSGVSTDTLTLITTLGSTNTSAYQNWTCSVLAYDGFEYESGWNNATIMVNPKIDLFISENNISITPGTLRHNQTITINATVSNLEENNATNVNVSLYVDSILNTSTIINISNNSQTLTQFNWTANEGNHTFLVTTDEEDSIFETNESNNNATYNVSVRSVAVLEHISPNGTFVRGKDTTDEDTVGEVENTLTAIARIYNLFNDTQGITADCQFFFNESLLGSNTTNETGHCTYTFDKTIYDTGTYNLSINFTNVTSTAIEHTSQIENTTSITLFVMGVSSNTENHYDGLNYQVGEMAVLNFSITKNSSLFDPDSIEVSVLYPADSDTTDSRYDGTLYNVSTGVYRYASLINTSPAGGSIRWVMRINSTADGLIATARHSDITVNGADGLLNITPINRTGSVINNSVNLVEDIGGYTLSQETVTTESVQNLSIRKDKNHSITIQIPNNHSLEINKVYLNQTNNTLTPQFVEEYQGTIPNTLKNFTTIIGFEEFPYELENATITFQKNGKEIDSIQHCDSWNQTTALCNGTWSTNTTEFSENATHIWFTVTEFSGYAGGEPYNANLTIWDQNDNSSFFNGGFSKEVNEMVLFYSNYSNATSGLSINSSCNISFNVTPNGPFNMTYNSSILAYQYNRSFNVSSTYSWNTTCSNPTYDTLTANDTITIFSANSEPNLTMPMILPSVAFTNSTLTMNITYTDQDNETGTVYIKWYVNNTNVFNQTNSSIANGTVINSTLASGNFSKNDLVNVSVYANDGEDNSSTIWSNTVNISNLPPTLASEIPDQSLSISSSTTINLSNYFTDLDEDTLNYTTTNSSLVNITLNQTTKIVTIESNSSTGSTTTSMNASDGENSTTSNNFTITVTQPSSSSSGGGGGGGSSSGGGGNCIAGYIKVDGECVLNETSCTPSWVCDSWTECNAGKQTRECIDMHACGSNTDQPILSQECSIPAKTVTEQPIQPIIPQNIVGKAFAKDASTASKIVLLVIISFLLVSLIVAYISTHRKISSLERLERWIERMYKANANDAEIIQELHKAGWNKMLIERAIYRVKIKAVLQKAYGLSPRKIRKIQQFIKLQAKQGKTPLEITATLTQAGWSKEVMKRYVKAYYPHPYEVNEKVVVHYSSRKF